MVGPPIHLLGRFESDPRVILPYPTKEDEMDQQERAITAAAAYLQRMGHRDLLVRPDTPEGMDIVYTDEGTLVGTVVLLTDRRAEADAPAHEQVRAALEALRSNQHEARQETTGLRVDLITLLIIAEDRALLRHHRGALAE